MHIENEVKSFEIKRRGSGLVKLIYLQHVVCYGDDKKKNGTRDGSGTKSTGPKGPVDSK
jgi:hypothetical protein